MVSYPPCNVEAGFVAVQLLIHLFKPNPKVVLSRISLKTPDPLSSPLQQATSFGSTAYVVWRCVATQVSCDLAELFEGGFKIFNDLLSEKVWIGKVVRTFQAFIGESEDVGAGLVAAL
jgi:hypothetical protein